MIITNITIRNFQSYYDTESIDFERGLNIIIGNGGKGKSKLFNAFYWVLFGKIYITGGMWCATRDLSTSGFGKMGRWEFLNKKALFEAQAGRIVTASVSLSLIDDKGKNITIERSVDALRTEVENWDCYGAWNIGKDNVRIIDNDGDLGTEISSGIHAEYYIQNLFPKSIRDYIWFQGESLDQLIDFRDKETFVNVMQSISYLPYYDKLISILEGAYKKIETDERKKTKEVNQSNAESSRLNRERDKTQSDIERSIAKIKEYEENINQISLRLAEDNLKLDGHIDYTQLVQDYNTCLNDVKLSLNDVEKEDEYQRRRLSELWILRGIDGMLDEAKQIIKEYTEEENTLPEKKYLDNPSRSKLEEILHDGKCFVCGADCTEGTAQHSWILHRLKEQEEYLKEMEEYRSNMQSAKRFTMFVGKIKDYPDELKIAVSLIDSDYKESEQRMTKFRNKYRKKNEELKELENQKNKIREEYGIDVVKEAGNAKLTKSRIKASESNLREQEKYKEKEITNKFELEKKLSGIMLQIDQLEKDGAYKTVPQTEWKDTTGFLLQVCNIVRENEKDVLRKKLTERANELYDKFTRHDSGYRGRVEIDEDYVMLFEPGLNTSHEDRKKMSYINALLSLSAKEIELSYPFISDAPTSSFDFESTFQYLMGIKDEFEQIIIMTKDVEVGSSRYEQLMSEAEIPRIYQLSSVIYEETSDEPEMHQVSTTIKPLKPLI